VSPPPQPAGDRVSWLDFLRVPKPTAQLTSRYPIDNGRRAVREVSAALRTLDREDVHVILTMDTFMLTLRHPSGRHIDVAGEMALDYRDPEDATDHIEYLVGLLDNGYSDR